LQKSLFLEADPNLAPDDDDDDDDEDDYNDSYTAAMEAIQLERFHTEQSTGSMVSWCGARR